MCICKIQGIFSLVRKHSPGLGYYPETSKIILMVHTKNLEGGKLFGLRHGFKVCTGARYLGRYIGDANSKRDWLKNRM